MARGMAGTPCDFCTDPTAHCSALAAEREARKKAERKCDESLAWAFHQKQEIERLVAHENSYERERDEALVEIARLRGRVAAIRSRARKFCDEFGSSDCILRGTDEGCQNMFCLVVLVDEILNADAGKSEADVIAAAEEQAKAHQYNLNTSQEEIGKQVLNYERACQVTNRAVDAMREEKKQT